MKKQIEVLGNFYRFIIPAEFIADIRAKYYSNGNEEEYEEEFNYALNDDYELKDWLSNNMNWEDVKDVVKIEHLVPISEEEDYNENLDLIKIIKLEE